MVIFDGFDPFFGPNGTPLAQDGPKWLATLIWRHNRNFHFLRKMENIEFWGMVIFYGFDPIFLPNGTLLASRWTLRVLHLDLAA